MSKVICPVDFSATSLNAVEFAAAIAAKMKSSLELVNVFTEDEFNLVVSSPQINRSFKEALADAREKLQVIAHEVYENYSSQGLLDCNTNVLLGDLEDTLLKAVNDSTVHYVVMGTNGVGKNAFFGSNTSHIIQKCNKPVICVPRKARFTNFDRIAYATNIHEGDKVMLQNVVSFGLTFNSRVYVLHFSHKSDKLENAELQTFFNELKSFVQYPKITFESKKIGGELSESLLSYMNEQDCNLLAVYSKSRNFFENLVHKSLAKELSIVSNQPIMVLK